MLVHDLLINAAERTPHATAVIDTRETLTYAVLHERVARAAGLFTAFGLNRGARVAIWLDKRADTVAAIVGASAAGGAFVPINPVLKPNQVAHILADSGATLLVTTADRAAQLARQMPSLQDLRYMIDVASTDWTAADPKQGHRVIETDLAAILYTSGSTGNPKGVALSHRNMVAGALSVASYLPMTEITRVAALLPLSFDAGLSQLTTSFAKGGGVLLHNYLTPAAALAAMAEYGVTGLTAVPPLWAQLLREDWSEPLRRTLRFVANTGGHMARPLLDALRAQLRGDTDIFLMYGLTEAFRSTFLPPTELADRPGSIGRAIPNADILVLRQDGTQCAPMEHGELVHRGPLVAQGYWNDPARTAERFRPLPQPTVRDGGFPMPEIAVFSGDTVYADDEGFLYFVGRQDDMIKTNGYRVSPSEIEEVVLDTGLVTECAALGEPHPELGQTILVVAQAMAGAEADILAGCRKALPGYMQPSRIIVQDDPLPRNPNGKIDRALLRGR